MKQCKEQSSPQRRRHRFNIMIDEVLPRNCQQDIWQIISSVSPSEFLVAQQDILNILLSDHRLFQSFFKRFYLNHLQLHNWYMLARQNQLEIKKYVFAQLLDKTYRHYRQAISDQQIRKRFAKMNEVFRSDDKEGKEGKEGKMGKDGKEGREKKKECFHKTPVGDYRKDKFGFSLCDQEKERRKQEEFQSNLEEFSREDYHELFLKTFNACDGSKYIYYDFDKHMRGMDQIKEYNTFIRIRKHSRMHNSLSFKPEDFPRHSGKQNSQSTYASYPPTTYFHEEEEKLEKMIYCNYNWSPIGSIDAVTQERQQHVIKRLPNVFKKVRPKNSQSVKAFLLRKKRVV